MRETYNFAPGSFGLVYRADVPDHGVRPEDEEGVEQRDEAQHEAQLGSLEDQPESTPEVPKEYKYQLKAMKWGLIPFWTKRSPDYGSMLRTINCRDDSLIENKGMWNTMKQRKRCLVICQGFYEWLKKGPGGKEKIPHFVKRKDGGLMYFAGLWDCVKYEDAEDKLYTYTIITTDSNKQLNFLHDRMPVILDAGSDQMKTWLDPSRDKWSKELQSILQPYTGELECYPVSREVGKVGNNSPNFIVPIDSKENKKNIANFFANAKSTTKSKTGQVKETVQKVKEEDEDVATKDNDGGEHNAPLPAPSNDHEQQKGVKREHSPDEKVNLKTAKTDKSPQKGTAALRKSKRSATSNGTVPKGESPKKARDGSQRITNFFAK